MKPQSSNHVAWIDLCRVAAIFGVVLIHSCGAAFYQYGNIPIDGWLSANFLDSLARCSVPLFVMISGALLLREGVDNSNFTKLSFRIINVLLPLLTWSAFYLIRNYYLNGTPIDWWSIFQQPAMYQLWFVYMIIGIYIMLPIFQVVFNAILKNPDLKIYLFVLWVIINVVPIYQPLPLLSVIQQNSFLGYGGYFILGGIVASSARDRTPSVTWLFLYLVGVLSTFGLTFWFSNEANAPVETAYSYFSLNVLVSTLAAFVLFSRISVPLSIEKTLSWVADKSFLIFFIHVLVLEYVRYNSFIANLSSQLPTLFVILIIASITFISSLLAASLIRLLPGARRVFG